MEITAFGLSCSTLHYADPQTKPKLHATPLLQHPSTVVPAFLFLKQCLTSVTKVLEEKTGDETE
jgi:hypothetical protein